MEGPAAAVLPQQPGYTAQPRDVQLGPGMHSSIQAYSSAQGVWLSPEMYNLAQGCRAQARDVQLSLGMCSSAQ